MFKSTHTSAYTHRGRCLLALCCFIGTSFVCLHHLESYFFGGRTFSSKKPWLTTFPAGKYLATTKEDPSLADALPTPIFFVFFHTMAVKCPVGNKGGATVSQLNPEKDA